MDWIRESSLDDISHLLRTYELDLFIGSVHHVRGVPIDFSRDLYLEVRNRVEGATEERLFEEYFDLQFDMLTALRPPLVGHFDLIRLLSDQPDGAISRWPGVWRRVLRNLDLVVANGGVLEINSAGLRKGMEEPYPSAEICKVRDVWVLMQLASADPVNSRNSCEGRAALLCPTIHMVLHRSLLTTPRCCASCS